MKLSKELQNWIQEYRTKNDCYWKSDSIKERNEITEELSELYIVIKDQLNEELEGTAHITVSKNISIAKYCEEIANYLLEDNMSIEQAIKDAVEYEKTELINEDDIKIEYENLG